MDESNWNLDWFRITHDDPRPPAPTNLDTFSVWFLQYLTWDQPGGQAIDHYIVRVNGTHEKNANGSPTVITASNGDTVEVVAVDTDGYHSEVASTTI